MRSHHEDVMGTYGSGSGYVRPPQPEIRTMTSDELPSLIRVYHRYESLFETIQRIRMGVFGRAAS